MTKKNLEYIDVGFEVKQIDDTDEEFFTFQGNASTFGNTDLVDDIVEPGAFSASIAKKIPVLLWQHLSDMPLGMPEELRETNEGLFIKGKLPKADTFNSGRVIPQIKVGSISAMSIGFRVVESEINREGIRLLQKVDLMEISLVTFPANTEARISGFKRVDNFYNVESVKDFSKRELEKVLRESGLFSKDAAILIAKDFTEQSESAGGDGDLQLSFLLDKVDNHQKTHSISQLINKVDSYARR